MFIFHVIIPALYAFTGKCYWLKYLYIQYAWISIIKLKIVTKMGRLKKWRYLSKLDHYNHKFQLFQLSYKILKEFVTEI